MKMIQNLLVLHSVCFKTDVFVYIVICIIVSLMSGFLAIPKPSGGQGLCCVAYRLILGA